MNGIAFRVGINLLGALRFLRFMQRDLVSNKDGFWIDAICINQSDVDEKNAQLGLMEHIYFRAKSVLVWLGEISQHITAKERAMLLENPYWDRLWILQELGRARRISICSRPQTLPWDDFVVLLKTKYGFADGDDEGPFRLDRCIVRQRFASLEQLLRDHIDAKCSNPLDKIYGLLGLASDGAGFPVDYRKSRFEVWRDTIRFINDTVTTDLTAMARLIKELLTRHDLVDSEAHQPEHFRPPTPREEYSKGLNLTVAIMGFIDDVGPPARDCIDDPPQCSGWSHQVQKSFDNSSDKDGALRANDKLLTALLELDDAQISNLCSSRAGPHTWEVADDAPAGLAALQAAQWTEGLSSESGLADRPRFCLLKDAGVFGDPMAPGMRLGLVSGVARLGDMLCRVRNSSKALLVRTMVKQDSPDSPDNTSSGATFTWYVRGVATVAEDVGPEPPDYNLRWESVETFPMMRVFLDAETLLQLIE